VALRRARADDPDHHVAHEAEHGHLQRQPDDPEQQRDEWSHQAEDELQRHEPRQRQGADHEDGAQHVPSSSG
jgi:hypothetical protein